MEKFKLKCGETLTLQAVNMVVVSGIQNKMMVRLFSDPEKAQRITEIIESDEEVSGEQILELFGDDVGLMAGVGEQLFSYCSGWGVKEDPPEDADELLEMLGVPEGRPHLCRSAWVRTLLTDQEEANELVRRVMELSQQGEDSSRGTGA